MSLDRLLLSYSKRTIILNTMSKQSSNQKYQDFLNSYFDKDIYTEKEINGYWLVKHFDGQSGKWVVYLYTQESYNNYKRGQAEYNEYKNQLDFINSI